MNVLELMGRNEELYKLDLIDKSQELSGFISRSSFLVIGAGGTIGQAVTKAIFNRNPRVLHCVDISENNLVELVRDLRSSKGYISGEFKTFAWILDLIFFCEYIKNQAPFDCVLNLSALKHVRSEKDIYTLARLLEVNVLNPVKAAAMLEEQGTRKYFCVSTDKAANPVNFMGASKLLMEKALFQREGNLTVSSARFANVAFSDGSLLFGVLNRISKRQPLAIPIDVRRYFMSSEESGGLCLLSAIFGDHADIFFPKPNTSFRPISFLSIIEKHLHSLGYEIHECECEDEARETINALLQEKKWPCVLFKSDTVGEKEVEEFHTLRETVDWAAYREVGVIKDAHNQIDDVIISLDDLVSLRASVKRNKNEYYRLFKQNLPTFTHVEIGKYLDEKM